MFDEAVQVLRATCCRIITKHLLFQALEDEMMPIMCIKVVEDVEVDLLQ